MDLISLQAGIVKIVKKKFAREICGTKILITK